MKRALALVWSGAPFWTLLSGVLSLLSSLLPLLMLWLVKQVVDATLEAARQGDPEAAFSTVLIWMGLLGGALLLGNLLSIGQGLVAEIWSRTVADHMQEILHRQSIALDLGYYENPRYHDTLHRAQAEAPTRPLKIVHGLTGLLQGILQLLALAALLALFRWWLALLVGACAIPAVLVRMRHARRLHRWHLARTPDEREAAYMGHLVTRRKPAQELRLFGLGRHFAQRFQKIRQRLRRELLRLAGRQALAALGARLLSLGALLWAATLVLHDTVLGRLTPGGMVMFVQAIQRIQATVGRLFGSLGSLYEDSLFLEDLYAFLDLEARIQAPAIPRALPAPARQGILFEGVSFTYPGARKPALQDIQLSWKMGQCLALVGHNGAGKSTLVKLATRLFDPTEGRITLDGHDLREFDPQQLRRLFSVHFQDFMTYDLSARENIALGDLPRLLGGAEAALRTAARKAGVHELIASLPEGYGAILGNWFEGGRQLSFGQWQKIALARAFFRQAPFLILDEPTSALDPEAEARLLKGFEELMQGRTTLLVSHRLASARLADRIAVLEEGRLLEWGSHQELLQKAGRYAEFFKLQARPYQRRA